MVATTSQNNISLLNRLQAAYPMLRFESSDTFRWSPQTRTVHYHPQELHSPEGAFQLLHEAGHALLHHQTYRFDVELLSLEAEAWQEAKELAAKLQLHIDEDFIQETLDTYRSWLAARSTCPTCQSAGLQSGKLRYSCLNCGASWRVNDAKFCALRRYRETKK